MQRHSPKINCTRVSIVLLKSSSIDLEALTFHNDLTIIIMCMRH